MGELLFAPLLNMYIGSGCMEFRFNNQRTAESCGCFQDLFGGSRGNIPENHAKNSGKMSPKSRNVVPACLQKLVGEFFLVGQSCGTFGGNFADFFGPTNKGLKISGKCRSFFS